jgi:two-component system, cell cycle response regulator
VRNDPWRVSAAQSLDNSHFMDLTQQLVARDSCRVLVVDDDVLVRARLSTLLNACQYDVEVAASGEEALRRLDAVHCNIVITDWQMPDMDGLALCRRIRLRPDAGYVYVILLTVRDSDRDVITGLAAGADGYIAKGATIESVLMRLEIGRRITREWLAGISRHNHGNRRASFTGPGGGADGIGYLMEQPPRDVVRSKRCGPLAVLHCEIDGFEQFSGRVGAEVGTDQLRAFLAGAGGCIRKEDWLSLAHGGAFVIVLPETAVKAAHAVANRLQQEFAHLLSTVAEPIGVAVTIGVTAMDVRHEARSVRRMERVLSATGLGCTYEQLEDLAQEGPPASTRPGGKSGLN